MIGIIGAMQIEIEEIMKSMTDIKTEKISNIIYLTGKINAIDCVAAISGVGKVNAAICAQTMILKYNVTAIINTGVAGGLLKELKVGDIAVATSVVQHDMDTSAVGDIKGLISGINLVNIPSDNNIINKIKKLTIKNNIFYGVIASGDQFINDKTKLNSIKSEFNAIACDMESASIGQVCYINNVKFISVRSISDNANNESHVDYEKFKFIAAKNSSDLILGLL